MCHKSAHRQSDYTIGYPKIGHPMLKILKSKLYLIRFAISDIDKTEELYILNKDKPVTVQVAQNVQTIILENTKKVSLELRHIRQS